MDGCSRAESARERLSLVIVNDDPAQLMVQKRLLGRIADVTVYLSPIEALAAARSGTASPYLVVDFHMPDLDGPELARIWCDLYPDARVLMVSASEITAREQDKFKALPATTVKLLTSYRITDLQDYATSWFCKERNEPVPPPPSRGDVRLEPSVLEKLGTLCGANFVAQTVARFLRSSPDKVQGIQAALLAGEYQRMHELAHSLKGSCGLVGALALSAVADRIETATEDGKDTPGLDPLVNELTAEHQATVNELEALGL